MAVNKNFVVKNGFEVNTDLILADAVTNRVGIGTTIPGYTLNVRGGIGATDLYVSGITTLSTELRVGAGGTILTVLADPGFDQFVGVGTAIPAYLLDVRAPVSTGQTALYVQGDVRITGDINLDDISVDVASINTLNVSGHTNLSGNLEVSGITTISSFVDINDYVDILDGLNVVGMSTFGNFVDINSNLHVSGISTLVSQVNLDNSLYVAGIASAGSISIGSTQVISSGFELQNIASLDATTTATIEAAIANSPNTFAELQVTGISTFVGIATFASGLEVVSGVSTFSDDIHITGDILATGISTIGGVQILSGIVTASSGIVTYYGDGTYLDLTGNTSAGIGIGTAGGVLGLGATFINFFGAGVSTAYYNSSVGIATIFFQGGGGGASIGIGTTPGEAGFPVGVVTSGNLWYNSNLGRLFIYYYDGTSSQWVDAAPFNVGVITAASNISFSNGSALEPSWYFQNSSTTGVFSPSSGEITFVSVGASTLNINTSGVNVIGITTLGVTTATNLTVQSVVCSGVATAVDFNSTSDLKLKENVVTVNNALLKVEQLRGVKFDWKENHKPSYGVIAQELEQVLPELVSNTDPKTVNYNGIIGVLIEAIKELKAEVEELKSNQN